MATGRDSEYPFRYIILGICSNENTGHVITRELSRGRGNDPEQHIDNVLRQSCGSYKQYDQLLLVTIGRADEESGSPLNLHTEEICVTPPPTFVLRKIERL